MKAWRSIPCSISELNLGITLVCGQSFRWRETNQGEWTSVLQNRVWMLKQTPDTLLYKVYPQPGGKVTNQKETDAFLRDYFCLEVDLGLLCRKWSEVDENVKRLASEFHGVRILRQDPTENLFSFICSSNNNIQRIGGMVEKLCSNFGSKVTNLEGVDYYSFPTVKSLAANGVEGRLRELGFGYRAKYINQSAKYIDGKYNSDWLNELRDIPYKEAHDELLKLSGVGAKVADCVCLMSLDKLEAIPVDTHVWQIATRDYHFLKSGTKTLTDTVYKEIGAFFRELWGPYAGWAQSIVFSADLKKFQEKKQVLKTKRRKGVSKGTESKVPPKAAKRR